VDNPTFTLYTRSSNMAAECAIPNKNARMTVTTDEHEPYPNSCGNGEIGKKNWTNGSTRN